MGKEDGGLVRHSVDCESEIDWDAAKIVACEYELWQREGIESIWGKKDGKTVLNNLEQLINGIAANIGQVFRYWIRTLKSVYSALNEFKNAYVGTHVLVVF